MIFLYHEQTFETLLVFEKFFHDKEKSDFYMIFTILKTILKVTLDFKISFSKIQKETFCLRLARSKICTVQRIILFLFPKKLWNFCQSFLTINWNNFVKSDFVVQTYFFVFEKSFLHKNYWQNLIFFSRNFSNICNVISARTDKFCDFFKSNFRKNSTKKYIECRK